MPNIPPTVRVDLSPKKQPGSGLLKKVAIGAGALVLGSAAFLAGVYHDEIQAALLGDPSADSPEKKSIGSRLTLRVKVTDEQQLIDVKQTEDGIPLDSGVCGPDGCSPEGIQYGTIPGTGVEGYFIPMGYGEYFVSPGNPQFWSGSVFEFSRMTRLGVVWHTDEHGRIQFFIRDRSNQPPMSANQISTGEAKGETRLFIDLPDDFTFVSAEAMPDTPNGFMEFTLVPGVVFNHPAFGVRSAGGGVDDGAEGGADDEGEGDAEGDDASAETAGHNVARLELSAGSDPQQLKKFLDNVLAASQNDLVVLDISAGDCASCKAIKPAFDKAADDFAESGERVKFANVRFELISDINGPLDGPLQELSNRFGFSSEVPLVTGFPTIIYFSQGKIVQLERGSGAFYNPDDKLDSAAYAASVRKLLPTSAAE